MKIKRTNGVERQENWNWINEEIISRYMSDKELKKSNDKNDFCKKCGEDVEVFEDEKLEIGDIKVEKIKIYYCTKCDKWWADIKLVEDDE